jgi:hypothetical protein
LYINHPNNTTTVYGHLHNFRKDIDEYIKDVQYQKETFEVDYKPDPETFPVKRGEMIGNGGNSGSSFGPHLHFEIRNSDTENPINPLVTEMKITDKVAPVLKALMIQPIDDNSLVGGNNSYRVLPVQAVNGKLTVNAGKPVEVKGNIGLAVEAYDVITGSQNKCGIYSCKVFLDQTRIFSFKFDEFPFTLSRTINSHVVYAEYSKTGRWFHKCWQEPGNKLEIYDNNWEKGRILAEPGKKHTVLIELADANGNITKISFIISGKEFGLLNRKENFDAHFEWDKKNSFETDGLEVEIPKGSLYTDLKFRHKKNPILSGFYSGLFGIHDNTVPLNKSMSLKIKADNLPDSLEDKSLIVKIDENSGRLSAAGGQYWWGWVRGQVREFGTYAIAVDNEKPVIIPLNLKNNVLTEPSNIRFKITDNLSGIKKIEGRLNGNWMLFDYDPKNAVIVHYFDEKRFELNKLHDFILKVTDLKDNTAVYESKFKR